MFSCVDGHTPLWSLPIISLYPEWLSVCRILQGLWVAMLQDWLILSTQPPHVQAAYQPRLFAAPTPSVLAAVKPFLQKAWPLVLAATCAVLSSAIEVGQD